MIRSGFFNSVNQDRKYNASDFAEYFASFISSGVFPNPSTNLQVVAQTTPDMTVIVRPGKAWINGYILINDDDYILQLEPADGVLHRIDRVVARYDTVDREIRLEVKKGTFASTPDAPALQRDVDAYELGLADVYIAAGVVSVTQTNITDLRFNTELCGIVKGTVDQIDTTDLFAQYQTAFNDWFQELKDVLDDNTAANLLNLINQLDDDLAAHLADYATEEAAGHIQLATEAEVAVGSESTKVVTPKNLKIELDKKIPTWGDLVSYAVSDAVIIEAPTERTVNGSVMTKLKEIRINGSGTLRISFDLSATSGQAQGQIYKNGSPVGILRTMSSSNYITYTEDIAGWKSNDLIQLYIANTYGSGHVSKCKNFIVKGDSPSLNSVIID